MFAVALHEIGHIFGLMHSSIDGSIMWPLLQNGLHTLNDDDIYGIQALYGVKSSEYPRNGMNDGNLYEIFLIYFVNVILIKS